MTYTFIHKIGAHSHLDFIGLFIHNNNVHINVNIPPERINHRDQPNSTLQTWYGNTGRGKMQNKKCGTSAT